LFSPLLSPYPDNHEHHSGNSFLSPLAKTLRTIQIPMTTTTAATETLAQPMTPMRVLAHILRAEAPSLLNLSMWLSHVAPARRISCTALQDEVAHMHTQRAFLCREIDHLKWTVQPTTTSGTTNIRSKTKTTSGQPQPQRSYPSRASHHVLVSRVEAFLDHSHPEVEAIDTQVNIVLRQIQDMIQSIGLKSNNNDDDLKSTNGGVDDIDDGDDCDNNARASSPLSLAPVLFGALTTFGEALLDADMQNQTQKRQEGQPAQQRQMPPRLTRCFSR
jgi:hypothetical protein